MINGKRTEYHTPPINTYFAAGFYPETDPEGAAFIRTHIGLHPLFRINGERYTQPQYAGMDLRDVVTTI